MKIENLVVGEIESNCYILTDEDKNCLIVDLGGDIQILKSYLAVKKYNPIAVLLTHGHADHIAEAGLMNLPVYISELDSEFLTDDSLNYGSSLGYNVEPISEVFTFNEGKLKIGNFEIEVIHTPGHTRGSCCFLIEESLFSGDTIMMGSFGRYDLKTGDLDQTIKSVRKLLNTLDENVIIYPGHGEATTIKRERKFNPLSDYVED